MYYSASGELRQPCAIRKKVKLLWQCLKYAVTKMSTILIRVFLIANVHYACVDVKIRKSVIMLNLIGR